MLEFKAATADLMGVAVAEGAYVVLVGTHRCLGSWIPGVIRVALGIVRMIARSTCADRFVPDIGNLDWVSSVDSWVTSA
jgi:hypothetical protein